MVVSFDVQCMHLTTQSSAAARIPVHVINFCYLSMDLGVHTVQQLIAHGLHAGVGKSPSGKASLQQSINRDLLSTLGDLDKGTSNAAADSNRRDWLTAGASWLSKNAFPRAAADGTTGDSNNTADADASSRSARHSRGSSSTAVTATRDSPNTAAQSDSKSAGAGTVTTSRSNQALADLGANAAGASTMSSSHNSSQGAWKSTLKHYYRQVQVGWQTPSAADGYCQQAHIYYCFLQQTSIAGSSLNGGCPGMRAVA